MQYRLHHKDFVGWVVWYLQSKSTIDYMFSAYNSILKCLLFNFIDALFLPEVLKDVFLQGRRRLAPPEIPADEFVHLFAKTNYFLRENVQRHSFNRSLFS
jgi:hypothetical protein